MQIKKLILGSASPRRKELLAGLDLNFIVDTENNFEENAGSDISPLELPSLMALGKSHGFHRELSDDEVLVTADTIVVSPDGMHALGKPHTRQEAVEMLTMLSGKTHTVKTSVVLRDSEHERLFSEVTEVVFAELSQSEISYYIDTYKPYDKAGAYAIQEWIGHAGIVSINGSYFNVMGLPTQSLYRELIAFGVIEL